MLYGLLWALTLFSLIYFGTSDLVDEVSILLTVDPECVTDFVTVSSHEDGFQVISAMGDDRNSSLYSFNFTAGLDSTDSSDKSHLGNYSLVNHHMRSVGQNHGQNGFLLVSNQDDDDFWITKRNNNGTQYWKSKFGYVGTEVVKTSVLDVMYEGDEKYHICGMTSNSSGHGQLILLSLSQSDGSILSSKKLSLIEETNENTDCRFQQLLDGTFAILSSSKSSIRIIKTDNGFSIDWVKEVKDVRQPRSMKMMSTSDNYLIVVVTYRKNGNVSYEADMNSTSHIHKFNTNGDVIWSKEIMIFDDGDEIFYPIIIHEETKVGKLGYVFSGFFLHNNESVNSSMKETVIFKTDRFGVLEWSHQVFSKTKGEEEFLGIGPVGMAGGNDGYILVSQIYRSSSLRNVCEEFDHITDLVVSTLSLDGEGCWTESMTSNRFNLEDLTSIYLPVTPVLFSFENEPGVIIKESDSIVRPRNETTIDSSFETSTYCRTCFGKSSLDTSQVCSGYGTCVNLDQCSCLSEYYGNECQNTTCGFPGFPSLRLYSNDSNVCSGRGTCFPVDHCHCASGSSGFLCEDDKISSGGYYFTLHSIIPDSLLRKHVFLYGIIKSLYYPGDIIILAKIYGGHPYEEVLLVRFNEENGSVVAARSFGVDSSDWPNDFHELEDGSIIVSASREYTCLIQLFRLSGEDFSVMWSFRTDRETAQDVMGFDSLITRDGGIIYVGMDEVFVWPGDLFNSGLDMFFCRFSSSTGGVEWCKLIGRDNSTVLSEETGYSVSEMPNGDFVFAGRSVAVGGSDPEIPGDVSAIFGRLTSTGEIIWVKSLGSNDQVDMGVAVTNGRRKGDEQNIYLILRTKSFGTIGKYDALLCKITGDGSMILWTRLIYSTEDTEPRTNIFVTNEGNLVFAARAIGFSTFENEVNILVAMFDPDGNLLWMKSLGSGEEELGELPNHSNRITYARNGGFYIPGFTHSFNYVDETAWAGVIARIDNDGNNCKMNVSNSSVAIPRYIEKDPSGLILQDYSAKSIDHSIDWTTHSGGWIMYSTDLTNNVTTSLLCYSCNNVLSTDNSTCSSHGVCESYDTCLCNESGIHQNFSLGEFCEFSCFKIPSYDEKNVCSGHGKCIQIDECICSTNYSGEHCNVTTCYGYWGNQSNVCQSRGKCVETDHCVCDGWFGDLCDYPKCFDKNYDEEGVCSGHGNCTSSDHCECFEGYNIANDCSRWYCYDILNNQTSEVCSGGVGSCVDKDKCVCHDPNMYFSPFCNVTVCGSRYSNDTDVCSGKPGQGTCNFLSSSCDCINDYYGPDCEDFKCFGFHYSNVEDVCKNHGSCVSPNSCNCDLNYIDTTDCEWSCYGYPRTSTETVCSGHGSCVGFNNCSCSSDSYHGNYCEFWNCFNISILNTGKVCGGHGSCVSVDCCWCEGGYNSEMVNGPCELWTCKKLSHRDQNVCNGRGVCVEFGSCKCRNKYEGDYCETWSCGVIHDNVLTCNGNGKCLSPDECKCKTGFRGKYCNENMLLYYVMTPILSGAGLVVLGFIILLLIVGACFCIVFCIVFCCSVVFILGLGFIILGLRFRMKHFGKLENFDILLREQEAEKDSSIAHIRVNKELFEIDFDELDVKSILGSGGSDSTVYLCKWRGSQTVAFKCFKTRMICCSQDKFDMFEREAEIFSSISHPSLLRFFGCTMRPPRVGIVMEYCSQGELLQFFWKYKEKNDQHHYPIDQKIRILRQICCGMEYLHNRKILHRDLKCENVLVDQNEDSKIMDFGLSKISATMSQVKTTRVGTSFYMAPEVVLSAKYSEKCDVFSFAILCFVMILEDSNIYGGEEDFGVEFRVANDENFRPNIQRIVEYLGQRNNTNYMWICGVIKTGWTHVPAKRPSFEELNRMFDTKEPKTPQYSTPGSNDKIFEQSEEKEKVTEKDLESKVKNLKKDLEFYEDFFRSNKKKLSSMEDLEYTQRKLKSDLDFFRGFHERFEGVFGDDNTSQSEIDDEEDDDEEDDDEEEGESETEL